MEKAIIFYNPEGKYDFRTDLQVLPKGSIVVAVLDLVSENFEYKVPEHFAIPEGLDEFVDTVIMQYRELIQK